MTEISPKRRAELRRECEPPITGTHKPVAYWELRTLLDYADERDKLKERLSEQFANQHGMADWVEMSRTHKHERDETVALLREARNFAQSGVAYWNAEGAICVDQGLNRRDEDEMARRHAEFRDRIDALLRRVGGSDE